MSAFREFVKVVLPKLERNDFLDYRSTMSGMTPLHQLYFLSTHADQLEARIAKLEARLGERELAKQPEPEPKRRSA